MVFCTVGRDGDERVRESWMKTGCLRQLLVAMPSLSEYLGFMHRVKPAPDYFYMEKQFIEGGDHSMI